MAYPTVDPQPSFPALEAEVLAFWEGDKTFQASVDARPAGADGANEYVFYDGPPFANGLPHYGHLLTGFVKDAVPRYQTMRGRRVERRFGWDCHGLPAEVEAEKELGSPGARRSPSTASTGSTTPAARQRAALHRRVGALRHPPGPLGRLRQRLQDARPPLHGERHVGVQAAVGQGPVYEGFRVLPYCWRCETPLSNTETRMDDVYRDRQDPALTVWFELEPTGDGRPSASWPGRPRRGRCRRTWRSPSVPTSTTP